MQYNRGHLGILTCKSGKTFSDMVVAHLADIYEEKQPEDRTFHYIDSSEIHFANGEIKTVINSPIRGHDAYIIQLMDDPLSEYSVNDNLMALGTAINAVYHSDAASITVVVPQFPNSRQEKRKGRESLTASMTASFLESCGAGRVLTIDIHAKATVGFFRKARMDNLRASKILMNDMVSNRIVKEDTVIVAPDVGSVDAVRYYSRKMMKDMALIVKERDYTEPSTVVSTRLVGDVEGKDVMIIDDMIATGGTLLAACEKLKEFGAKDINVSVTFPFFNGQAVEKIGEAHKKGIIKSITGTNAVFRGEEFHKGHSWYREVDVTRLFADVIYRINHMESISALLV